MFVNDFVSYRLDDNEDFKENQDVWKNFYHL